MNHLCGAANTLLMYIASFVYDEIENSFGG